MAGGMGINDLLRIRANHWFGRRMSSMEAEYIAAMEAIWICKLISGLGVVSNNDRPMDIEVIQEGDIRIRKVHTDDTLADPFTKLLSCTKHVEHARNIRPRPAGSFM
nr:hypothetical protein [Tanacetum cinerariifolium]